MAVWNEDSEVPTEDKTQEADGRAHVDDTGAAIPDISIQVSERAIPMDIWITFRHSWKRDARDSGKLSHIKILRMEKNVSSQGWNSFTVRRTSSKPGKGPIS